MNDWRSASCPVQVLRDLDVGALAVERDLEIARIDLEVRGKMRDMAENRNLWQKGQKLCSHAPCTMLVWQNGRIFGKKPEMAEVVAKFKVRVGACQSWKEGGEQHI